jgi:hypothetical protein
MNTIVQNFARFWSAPTLWRFDVARFAVKSGRGLPQSKTLARKANILRKHDCHE